jgi:hypothetical protein
MYEEGVVMLSIDQLRKLKEKYITELKFVEAAEIRDKMMEILGSSYDYYSHGLPYDCICSGELLHNGCMCGGK